MSVYFIALLALHVIIMQNITCEISFSASSFLEPQILSHQDLSKKAKIEGLSWYILVTCTTFKGTITHAHTHIYIYIYIACIYIYIYIYTYVVFLMNVNSWFYFLHSNFIVIIFVIFWINIIKLCKPLSRMDLWTFLQGSIKERTHQNT